MEAEAVPPPGRPPSPGALSKLEVAVLLMVTPPGVVGKTFALKPMVQTSPAAKGSFRSNLSAVTRSVVSPAPLPDTTAPRLVVTLPATRARLGSLIRSSTFRSNPGAVDAVKWLTVTV